MKKHASRVVVWAVLCVGFGAAAARAEALEFDFDDPKGVNNIYFLLDSTLEPIMGLASEISGTVTFDPDDPKSTTGRLVVAADSLHFEHPKMKEMLDSPDWMDAARYPEIAFEFKQVQSVKNKDNVYELKVQGAFTCRGVTRDVDVTVKATYLPGKLSSRLRGREGDLLVLRAEFKIKRSDYGINPRFDPQMVADEIQIRAPIVGIHQK